MPEIDTSSSKIDLAPLRTVSFFDAGAYCLSLIDFSTTARGIAMRALDLDGPIAWLAGAILGLALIWMAVAARDKIPEAIDDYIVSGFMQLSKNIKQGGLLLNIVGLIKPTIITLVIIALTVVDFSTSFSGLNEILPFTGVLGFVTKIMGVFILVFASVYVVYIKPRSTAREVSE